MSARLAGTRAPRVGLHPRGQDGSWGAFARILRTRTSPKSSSATRSRAGRAGARYPPATGSRAASRRRPRASRRVSVQGLYPPFAGAGHWRKVAPSSWAEHEQPSERSSGCRLGSRRTIRLWDKPDVGELLLPRPHWGISTAAPLVSDCAEGGGLGRDGRRRRSAAVAHVAMSGAQPISPGGRCIALMEGAIRVVLFANSVRDSLISRSQTWRRLATSLGEPTRTGGTAIWVRRLSWPAPSS